MLDRGQAFRRRRHLHHQILALDVLPEPLGLGDGALGVHRQIGRDFEADKTVVAVQLVVDRTQHVGGVLDVLDRELLEQVGDRAVALFQRLADRAVIFVRTADRLFEDRRVRGHALDAVGVDQLLQVALGDEAAGEEIQPDRLAVVFECFDGIHDACSVRSVGFRVPGSFRGRGGNVNTWSEGLPGGIWSPYRIRHNAIRISSIPRTVMTPGVAEISHNFVTVMGAEIHGVATDRDQGRR